MPKIINLFFVETTYQYLSAVNLCIVEYNDSTYDNHIYYLRSDKLDITNPEAIYNFNGFIKPIEPDQKIKYIKFLATYECTRFFFYQENSILNKYIAYKLRKKGTIICLGPDGTKPYGVFKKDHEFLSIVKDTMKDYILLYKNRLFLPLIIPSRYYKYGSTFLIDEIYLQYPELFDLKSNKVKCKVLTLPELINQNVKEISKSFGFNISVINKLSGSIIYFNQPLWSNSLIQKELEILKNIILYNPGNLLYIKLHPSTPDKTKELYSEILNLVLIEDKRPAEFYTAHFSNTICISGWSTALMHNLGKSNRYYYLYPIFKELDDKILSQIKLIGFSHIKMIESLLQLKDLN